MERVTLSCLFSLGKVKEELTSRTIGKESWLEYLLTRQKESDVHE